jgi:hypothetical protein
MAYLTAILCVIALTSFITFSGSKTSFQSGWKMRWRAQETASLAASESWASMMIISLQQTLDWKM